jgi:hypothetical protein
MLNDKGEVPDEEYTLPIGKADVVQQGDDLTIISYGKPMRMVKNAVKQLEEEHEICADLIDLRTLRPLDVDTIAASVKKTNRVLIVDEDYGYCGMGAAILGAIQTRPQRRRAGPVQPLPRVVHAAERGKGHRGGAGNRLPIRRKWLETGGRWLVTTRGISFVLTSHLPPASSHCFNHAIRNHSPTVE